VFTRPGDDGAVVRALARNGEHFARLSAGTAEVAVVERDGGEALLAEALGERRQSSRFDATNATAHPIRSARDLMRFLTAQPLSSNR
jgi:hypothetical protein